MVKVLKEDGEEESWLQHGGRIQGEPLRMKREGERKGKRKGREEGNFFQPINVVLFCFQPINVVLFAYFAQLLLIGYCVSTGMVHLVYFHQRLQKLDRIRGEMDKKGIGGVGERKRKKTAT